MSVVVIANGIEIVSKTTCKQSERKCSPHTSLALRYLQKCHAAYHGKIARGNGNDTREIQILAHRASAVVGQIQIASLYYRS
jgi:hypothetical protein